MSSCMMTEPRVTRSSEPYSDYGNLSGEGARRLLGTPATDPLLTAIRESVQNSWDARLEGEAPVFLLRLRTLDDHEYRYLRDVIFDDLSPDAASPLRELLREPSIRVAEICDFRTLGLTGTTRPSRVTNQQDSRFVRFLRNIGTPRREGSGSGGTYGYGKSSLFSLSSCQTVIVDSLTSGEDGPSERRLMASRMGEEFHDPGTGRSFTGRHWWGSGDNEGEVVEPVRGDEAARLAERVGLAARESETGTSVLILDPQLETEWEDHSALASYIHRALLWFFWPKMVPREGETHSPMEFRVEIEGQDFPVPSLEESPPFHIFSDALQVARSLSPERAYPIEIRRPHRTLGWTGYKVDLLEERPCHLHGEEGVAIPTVSHHVALLRPAELVVKYLEGPAHAREQLEWAGVFICSSDSEIESAFAAAEPPTHDDWNYASLPARTNERSYVKVALERINQLVKDLNPDPREHVGGNIGGLAGIADTLGTFLLSGRGDRAVSGSNGRRRKNGGGNRRARLRLSGVTQEGLEREGERRMATFSFTVEGEPHKQVLLSAEPTIVAEGGDKVEVAPDGTRPQVKDWIIDGEASASGSAIEIPLTDGRLEGRVRVTVPTGVAVRPRISVQEVSDE